MKKMLKATAVFMIAGLCLVSTGCSSDLENRVSQLESRVEALETTNTPTQASNNAQSAQEDTTNATSTETKNVYGIGDTWTVDGQWSLTINSVTPSNYRNEFSDKTPAAVYNIDYTYTNIGYEDPNEIADGLYLSLDLGSIVDSAGIMGYSYPGDVTSYPQAAPVGATCNAQACIGVDNAGNFTIRMTQYDGNNEKQSAQFNIVVE